MCCSNRLSRYRRSGSRAYCAVLLLDQLRRTRNGPGKTEGSEYHHSEQAEQTPFHNQVHRSPFVLLDGASSLPMAHSSHGIGAIRYFVFVLADLCEHAEDLCSRTVSGRLPCGDMEGEGGF
jgi:hypothetical protein